MNSFPSPLCLESNHLVNRKVEIASAFEKMLGDGSTQPGPKVVNRVTVLSGTRAAEDALLLCLDPASTFIVRLAHNLLKLGLQVIEKYHRWALGVVASNANFQGIDKLLLISTDAELLASRLEANDTGELLPHPTSTAIVTNLAPIGTAIVPTLLEWM